MDEPFWITSEALRLIHEQQLERFGGRPGILDENVVESALARPRNLFAYGEDVDLAALAAAYLFGFAAKQGFADGNKRTALATALVFLHTHGKALHVEPQELYEMTMRAATNRATESEVAAWLRERLP